MNTSTKNRTIAYHGTPYNFSEFSLKHIGEGEGAQVHGWGIYFAADRSVAETYRNMLGIDKYYADSEIITNTYEEKIALEIISEDSPYPFDTKENRIKAFLENIEFRNAYERIKDKRLEMRNSGRVYVAEIPEESTMLYEDLRFNEQPEKVQEALNKIFWDIESLTIDEIDEYYGCYTGRSIYEHLTPYDNDEEIDYERGDELASCMLNEYGIKGIVYDGRQDGRGYVVFDNKEIKILDTL